MSSYIITIAQQKGGAGKSTIAAHLAVALAKSAKVAVIDTDPQQTLTKWHSIRENSAKSKLVNFDFIYATGWKVGNEIARLKHADIIIIDSPPHMESETKAAIRAANLVIVPCQPSPNDFWATNATIEIIRKEKKDLCIVLNRCPYQSKLLKQIEEDLPADIKKYFLGNRVAFASSMLVGLTAMETESNSVAAAEIFKLTNAVKQFKKGA